MTRTVLAAVATAAVIVAAGGGYWFGTRQASPVAAAPTA